MLTPYHYLRRRAMRRRDTEPLALTPVAEDTEWLEYDRGPYDPEVDDEADLAVFLNENAQRITARFGENVLVSETDEYIEVEVGAQI